MTGEDAARGVAIIGIACRFPGAPDARAFWSNLVEGVDSIRHFSDAELLRAGIPERTLNRPDYVKAAPVIDGHDLFDAGFFEYSPREARLMDPQQRILLEEAWHALEDAGHPPGGIDGRVGVFTGSGGVVTSYLAAHAALRQGQTGGIEHLGNDKDFVSTRLSYKLGLTGPSINVQTACSTSLVAVHLACQSILDGECEMALAGGATVRVPHVAGYTYRQGDILSPDGRCRAYDADAQGTVFGSGAGLVVLKHVEDALADGDRIYAVIRGSAINNDGAAKVSFTASSTEGQSRAMIEALAAAGVDPSTIGYVEGHGTGTVVGDPLEVEALRRCFSADPETRAGGCWLGSVKTNIGHLEQTAGVASLIKAALAVHHGRVPPSLNFQRPNPRIDFANSPFRVPVDTVTWPERAGPRRAAVNSLGLGGTNAFAIVEEAPDSPAVAADVPPRHVLALSARSEAALADLVDRWRDHLAADTVDASAACFTAATGREPLRHRLTVTGPDAASLAAALAQPREATQARKERKVAFLFPGQGAQAPGMARAFHGQAPAFREAFEEVAAALADEGIDVARAVFGDTDAAALANTRLAQPALFAVEYALARMLNAWGLAPHAVLGHSVGAFAAAAVAGIWSPADAARLIARRASLMADLPEGGEMTALLTDEAEATRLLDGIDGLGIAALNSPSSTVVSGPADRLPELEQRAETEGIAFRRLAVSHAFHSPLMEPAAGPLTDFADVLGAQAPGLAFVSDCTGQQMTEAPDGDYLARHLLQPVRFAESLRTLAQLGCTDFVEVGPGAALRGFVAATLPDAVAHGVLDPKGDDLETAASTLGRLWERGVEVDISRLYPGQRRGDAPLYPFERKRYWLDDAPAEEQSGALHGREVRVPGSGRHFQAAWSVASLPWLADHRVYGHVTLPVAGALITLADAASSVLRGPAEIRRLTYSRACTMPDDGERLLDLEMPGQPDEGALTLSSIGKAAKDDWERHIEATVAPAAAAAMPVADLDALRQRCADPVDPARFYAVLNTIGLNYGPVFRAVRELWLGRGEALGRVSLGDDPGEVEASLHPALLDACLHLFPALSGRHGDFSADPDHDTTYLPISVERFRIFAPAEGEVWSHCVLRDGPEDGRFTLDVHVYAPTGAPVAIIEGLTVREIPRAAFVPKQKTPVEDWLYAVEWIARPALPEPTATAGRWLIVADREADIAPVTDAFSEAGADYAFLPADELLDSPELPAGPVAGLVLASALSDRPLMRQGVEDIARLSERQFRLTQAALRMLTEDAPADWGQPRLWIVTRGAQAPLEDRLGGEAAQAVLWGHGRVVALEHPGVWGGMIDLDQATDGPSLVRELLARDGEDQIALRGGKRYAPRLVRQPLSDPDLPVTPAIRADQSYLITGGLGVLGLKVARWLIGEGARHLWLVSRRKPGEAQQAEIAALETLGVTVRVASADISDAPAVEALIAQISAEGPPLDGIFHAAGLLDDGIALGMEWEQYHRVTRAKIEGAWALHLATRQMELSHFVLFSSILSLIGSMGQLNYVAGNAFLDALVQYRRRLGLAATAMNWGPWEDAGLATESGERGRQIWRARGTEYIPAEAGIGILGHALSHGFDHLAVTITDWSRFVGQFAEPPRLYERLTSGAGRPKRAETFDRSKVIEQLRSADAPDRHGLVAGVLGQICASALELDQPPEPELSLREAGLDSLMSITVINEIEAVFGVRLPARALLQGPSVGELATTVLEALPGLADAPAHGDAPLRPKAPAGKPGEWLVVRRPRPEARVRLFCFPFAGGGSAVFDGWGEAFDPSIEIVAVEPPGRLSRIDEPPLRSAEAFARALLPQLSGKLDRPYAMLGHCLGGLTLYETVRFLQARKRPLPVHIFVSGARPPSVLKAPGDFESELEERLRAHHDYRSGRPSYEQPDAVFAEIVRSFGITQSIDMLEQQELRDLVLPTVRAEFEMGTRYAYLPEDPLPVPITCFRGGNDAYFRAIDARIWRKFTSRRFELFTRPGIGHFAIVEDFEFIREAVEERLLVSCAETG